MRGRIQTKMLRIKTKYDNSRIRKDNIKKRRSNNNSQGLCLLRTYTEQTPT